MYTKSRLPILLALALFVACAWGCISLSTPEASTTPSLLPPTDISETVSEPASLPTGTFTPISQPAAPTITPAEPTAVPDALQTPESLVAPLLAYTNTISDILEAGQAALQRQIPLLSAAGIVPATMLQELDTDVVGIITPLAPDAEAVCGGPQTAHPTLIADAVLMQALHAQLSAITPPQQAANWVHRPLLNCLAQWGDALEKINASCETAATGERQQLRAAGGLALGEAYVNFMFAGVAAQQLFVWSGLIDAAEAIAADDNGTPIPAVCIQPELYYPNAQLAGANLASADLSYCTLTNADLRTADLGNANLSQATLVAADLRDAVLINAILDRADLTGARLNGADLRNAILSQTILTGADLSDADLRNAILQGTLLDQVIWQNTLCPDGSNSDTNGLDACLPE